MSNRLLTRWFSALIRPFRNRRRGRTRADHVELAFTELETRRVLNGDGAFTELVVDAGEYGDDGQADDFEIDVESGLVTVSLGGEVVNQADANGLDAIRIIGSNDDDRVHVEFADGVSDQFEVVIDGRGGDDTLTLTGDGQFESLIHSIRQPTSGSITANGASRHVSIDYRGLETIQQELDAVKVLIDLSQSDADALLALGSNSEIEFLSEDAAMSLSFRNPAETLLVDTGSGTDPLYENQLEVFGRGTELNADVFIRGDELDRFSARGEIQFGGEVLDVASGEVDWDSRLTAIGARIELAASESLNVTDWAVLNSMQGEIELTAQSIRQSGEIVAHGGRVILDSGDTGTTIVDGLIDASSSVGLGGEVQVLGMHVGLLEQAFINVSGVTGGGTALFGGDYQGENSLVRNAERTYVSAHAVVMADAIASGDGGRVIFWADQWTRFAGTVSARGGSVSGSGGFVEVSGKQSLDYRGSVDLSAANGDVGLLLLDPQNIVIANSGANDAEVSTDSEVLFDDGLATDTFTISASAFQTSTANITLQATNDITVNEAITLTQAGVTLAFQAGHDLIINANITGASSNQFIFEADSVHTTDGAGTTVGVDGDGELSIAAVTIDSAGGDIHMLAENFAINTSASIAAGAGDVYVAESDGGGFGSALSSDELATISSTGTLTIGQANTAGTDNAGTGAQTTIVNSVSIGTRTFAATVASTIRFVANNGVTFTNDVTTNQGLVIDADANDDGSGTFTSGSNDDVLTNNSNISITAAALSMSGDLNAGTGDVLITTSDGSDIGVGDPSASGMQISRTEFSLITASNLTVETTGVIAVDNIQNNDSDQIGTVMLRATGTGSTVTFNTDASSFDSLVVEATDGVTVGVNVTTDVGGIWIDADTDGNDGAGALVISSGATINSGDEAILLIADTMDLGGNVDAGAGDVTIQDSDGNGIDLGASTGGLDLSNTEFQRIAAANLNAETDGNITVAGITQPASITGGVNLVADGSTSTVTFSTASSFSALSVSANEGIAINADLATTAGGLNLDANRDTSVDDTGTLTVATGVAVSTNNDSITIAASDIDLTGTISAGTSSITITEDGTGASVGDGGSSGLVLSASEMAQLTATGLTLNTTGSVDVGDVAALDSDGIGGAFSIVSAQTVTLSSGRTAIFNSLSVSADQGISLNGDLSTDTGDLTLDADANNSADVSDNLAFASGVVVESAGALNLEATSGSLSATGSVTLYAADGITISDNLTVGASGGVGLTIDADRDAGDGLGSLSVASGCDHQCATRPTRASRPMTLDLQGSVSTNRPHDSSDRWLGIG